MITFKLDINEIVISTRQLPEDLQKAKLNALREIGELLVNQIYKRAPFKTGNYANSWKVSQLTPSRLRVSTRYRKLFQILEFKGRTAGRIAARNAKVLAFEIDGKKIFAKYVNHPGFPPIPHARPALTASRQKMKQLVYKHLSINTKIFRHNANKFRNVTSGTKTGRTRTRRTVTRKTGRKRLVRKRAPRVKVDKNV